MAFITINEKTFPAPDVGLNMIVSTNVSDGLNALGEFIGDKVGRDKYKISGMQWKRLDAATWSAMLKEFNNFVVIAKIPDMVNNQWITLRMYPGDRTATPIACNEEGFPIMYQDCKVNIIDCGVIE